MDAQPLNNRSVNGRPRTSCCYGYRPYVFFLVLISSVLLVAVISIGTQVTGFGSKNDGGPSALACIQGEFACRNGLQCFPSSLRCDGQLDCSDLSDEDYCPGGCVSKHTFNCTDGRCIKKEWRCDREPDCADRSDELGCDQCTSSQFSCFDYSCVALPSRCNGHPDCSDGSDEVGCLTLTPVSSHLKYNGVPVCFDSSLTTPEAAGSICLALNRSYHGASISAAVAPSSPQYVHLTPPAAPGQVIQGVNTTCAQHTVAKVTCKGCGQSSKFITESLVGGTPVGGSTEWPWFVKVISGGVELCGGSLLSARHVLTAAHCVHRFVQRPHQVKITVGSIRFDAPATHTAAQVVIHSQFVNQSGAFYYDFAILELTAVVQFSSTIHPVCLPSKLQSFSTNAVCYITGFGAVLRSGEHTPDSLQEAKTRLMPKSTCDRMYENQRVIFGKDILCAGYLSAGIDTCLGDSGGPLVCYVGEGRPGDLSWSSSRGVWTVVGVTSWAFNCGQSQPAVYGDVRAAVDWILSVINR